MPERVTLPSGFSFDRTAANAHVMQPAHTQGVISSRGLEEGTRLKPQIAPAGVTLGFNTDGFVAALNAALADNTAGYVMQLPSTASRPGELGQASVGRVRGGRHSREIVLWLTL
jgi:hypothetical protein